MSWGLASRLDRHAYADTQAHRLDARVKLIAVLTFIVTVVSFPKYDLAGPAPLVFFPLLLAAAARVPVRDMLIRLAAVSPFAVLIAAANPFLDTRPYLQIGTLSIAGGWISFASVMLKFALTVSAAMLLAALTPMGRLAKAAVSLGVPHIMVNTLLFIYRYLFVLADEVGRMLLARRLRAPQVSRPSFATAVSMFGVLLTRSFERAERIHQAMLTRGFDGRVRALGRSRLQRGDALFLALTAGGCLVFRFVPVSEMLGAFLMRGI